MKNLKNEKTDRVLLLIECIFMAFLIGLIIFKVAHMPGQDYKFHYGRIRDVAYEIQNFGIQAFPTRIYSNCLDGYGYANPLFYGDVMLYLPGLIVACGASVITGYKILMIMTLLLCFACMYFCAYKISGSKNTALFVAGTYAFSTYFATDLFVRNAIGEATAMVFVPIAFYGLYAIINDKGKDWIYLPLGMIFIIWSHVITTFVFTVIAFILLCINFRKITKSLILKLLGSVVITVLITANYIFPMIEQLVTDKFLINGDIGLTADMTTYSIPYFLMVIPRELLEYINLVLNKILHMNLPTQLYAVGPAMFIYSIVLCLGLRFVYREKLKPVKKDRYLVLILIIVLISLPFFPIKLLVPVIGFIQFPWRFFVMATLFVSIYLMYVYMNIDIKKLSRFIMIGFCLLFTINIAGVYTNEIMNSVIAKDITYDEVDVYSIGSGEYLPVECWDNLIKNIHERERVVTSNNDISVNMRQEGKKTIVNISNNNFSDTVIEVPLIMYKGYSAVDNNSNEFEIVRGYNGLINVNVKDYNGDVYIEYTGTTIQHISFYISLTAIVLCVICLIAYKRK